MASDSELHEQAIRLLTPHGYQHDASAVSQLVEWLREGLTHLDPYRRSKVLTEVKEEMTRGLKFVLKQTHVGDWLNSAEKSVALLRVFKEMRNVGSPLGNPALYDTFLALFPNQTKLQLGNSRSDSRTPEQLFRAVESCFPDKLAALQSLVQTSPETFRQKSATTFAAHVENNMSEYRGHYVRQELNVRMYLNTLQHTHRLDSRQRSFAAALLDELLQDHRSGSLPALASQPEGHVADPWEHLMQQPVHTLLCYAHRMYIYVYVYVYVYVCMYVCMSE